MPPNHIPSAVPAQPAVPSSDGAPAPLVRITEFATPPPAEWLRIRADRYAQQAVGRLWAPDHRIAFCHRWPRRRDLPVELWHAPGNGERDGRASFHMLMCCESPWADPVCAGGISDRRRVELGDALAVHRGAGGAVHLLTYTARHNDRTALSVLLRALLRARRAMRSPKGYAALRRRYGHVGSVTATEITLGRHGWHPHFHELWFGDAGVAGDLAAEIRRRWMAALQDEGLDGLPAIAADVREASMTVDEYVTKYGRQRKWDVDAELAKAIAKRGKRQSLMPFDVLRLGVVSDDRELLAAAQGYYREYVGATKGKSTLHWSPGLKAHMGIKDVKDAEIAGGLVDGPSILLGHIQHDDWRRIMVADARIEVLAAAATGEWPAVQAVLDDLPAAPRSGKWHAAATRAEASATPADRERVREAELWRMIGG
jgi:hypothetical protein